MTKRIFNIVLLSMSMTAYAGSFQAGINELIQKTDPNINMGIEVIDLNTDDVLYSRDIDGLLAPASNMKLISNAAAYLALGPDYRFQTSLLTNATVLQNGVLKGPLFFKLPGDPSLTSKDLDELIKHLKDWGVTRVSGNIIIDSSHSDVSPYAKGIVPTDKRYAYGAPVAPVVLDQNRLTVTINPASHAGDLAIVDLSEASSIKIDNQIKTVGTSKGCGVGMSLTQANVLQLRGCIAVGQWSVVQKLPITSPLKYMIGVLHQHFKRAGILIDGKVGLGSVPSKSMLVATHASKPLTQIMAETLKPSDNLFADSLFLHAADKIHGSKQNWAGSAETIKEFLTKQTGVNFDNAILNDGSGLSRDDRLSVNQTVHLLRFLHHRFPISYEFMSALPIAGRDGTLEKRFKGPNEKGMVRAKTGTMTGIMGLSGYLYTQNGHTLAFAMFINKKPKTPYSISGNYRPMMDAIVGFMINEHPTGGSDETLAIKNSVLFEQKPNQIGRERAVTGHWRTIETVLKKNLAGQSVDVLFKGNHIVLKDNSGDINRVWAALKAANQRVPFSVILKSVTEPTSPQSGPTLLWVKSYNVLNRSKRTWTLNDIS